MWIVIVYSFVCSLTIAAARKANGDGACTAEINATIHRCVAPVKRYAETLGSTMNNHPDRQGDQLSLISSAAGGVEMFQELCQLIKTFEECIKEARYRCPRHVLINLIDSSYGYLCKDGYDNFMSNAQCLMSLDQDPAVKQCHTVTVREIFTLYNSTKFDVDQRLTQLCAALSSFTFCIQGRVKKECGNTAWSIIDKVLKDTTKTLIPSCTFVPPPDKANFTGERVQFSSITNRTAYSREDSLTAKLNATPETKYNGQLRNNNGSANVQGSTEPQKANCAFSFGAERLLYLFVTFIFALANFV